MREKAIESQLKRACDAKGWLCIKLGISGWPDRIIVLPNGRVAFVELKRPGKLGTATVLQRLRISQLTRSNACAFISDNADVIIERISRELEA